jgi:hypothetical protein
MDIRQCASAVGRFRTKNGMKFALFFDADKVAITMPSRENAAQANTNIALPKLPEKWWPPFPLSCMALHLIGEVITQAGDLTEAEYKLTWNPESRCVVTEMWVNWRFGFQSEPADEDHWGYKFDPEH